jgi:cytochrome P450
MPNAIEEVLRHSPPIMQFRRWEKGMEVIRHYTQTKFVAVKL